MKCACSECVSEYFKHFLLTSVLRKYPYSLPAPAPCLPPTPCLPSALFSHLARDLIRCKCSASIDTSLDRVWVESVSPSLGLHLFLGSSWRRHLPLYLIAFIVVVRAFKHERLRSPKKDADRVACALSCLSGRDAATLCSVPTSSPLSLSLSLPSCFACHNRLQGECVCVF